MSTAPDYFRRYPMVQTYVGLARSYKKNGQVIDAFNRFERALDVCYMNNADSLMDDIRQEMIAIELGTNAPEQIRNRQRAIQKLLVIKEYLENADFESARKELNDLVNAGCTDPELYIQLGSLALQENKKEDAAQNLFTAAQSCYRIRAIVKAEAYCRQVLRLDPNRLEARVLLIEIYRRQGSTNLASIEMLSIVREYLKKSKLEEAFTYVQKAVDIGNMEAHYIQGLICFHDGKLDEAKKKFDLVNDINKQHTGALSFLARIYQKQNLIENAKDTYEKLIKIQPQDAEAHFKLADMLLKKGLRDKAVEHYQKASQLYAAQDKPGEAEAAARMAHQLWGTLAEGERPCGGHQLIEQEETPVSASEPRGETEFEVVSKCDAGEPLELVAVFKKASVIDKDNAAIKQQLTACEDTIINVQEDAASKLNFLIPVGKKEIDSLSHNGKKLIIEKLRAVAHEHHHDKNIQSKIDFINSAEK